MPPAQGSGKTEQLEWTFWILGESIHNFEVFDSSESLQSHQWCLGVPGNGCAQIYVPIGCQRFERLRCSRRISR